MVIQIAGQLLQQVAKVSSKYITRQNFDIMYAGAIGTGIGIGANPDVREAYELWKGNYRGMSWRDKVTRHRVKGDAGVDYNGSSTSPQRETLRPAVTQNRYSKYSRVNYRRVGRKRFKCKCRKRSYRRKYR